MRLVKETDAERMLQRVLAHIRAQGFHVLMDAEPDDETRARYPRIVRVSRVSWTNAYRTEMTLPESQARDPRTSSARGENRRSARARWAERCRSISSFRRSACRPLACPS